jgi:outer membrane protein assembly factor BamB
VICTAAGAGGGILALHKNTGEVVWHSKSGTHEHHYSSVVPATIHGTPQYVQLSMDNIRGFAAKDGKLLWETAFPGQTAVIPTPVVRDNLVYVTAGYGVGCKQVRIGPDNQVETVFENKVMKNHHGGVVLLGGHVYGHAEPGWTCQDFKTGEEVWNHRGFGKGATGSADGMLYCLEEGSGAVALVEASPKEWQERGRFTLDPQSTIRSRQGRIWTHPVISHGRLYLRDQDLIYCYDVRQR